DREDDDADSRLVELRRMPRDRYRGTPRRTSVMAWQTDRPPGTPTLVHDGPDDLRVEEVPEPDQRRADCRGEAEPVEQLADGNADATRVERHRGHQSDGGTVRAQPRDALAQVDERPRRRDDPVPLVEEAVGEPRSRDQAGHAPRDEAARSRIGAPAAPELPAEQQV